MNKQKYIEMSLSEEVKFYHIDGDRETVHICHIAEYRHEEVTIADNENEYYVLTDELLPILRPLYDLTKPITHNGETFVPIVELAKITDGCSFRKNWKLDFNRAVSKSTIHGTLVFGIVIIQNKIETFTFHNQRGYREQSNNIIKFIQKLIEWHFDISGLIKNGEAIDVNTFEVNPYA